MTAYTCNFTVITDNRLDEYREHKLTPGATKLDMWARMKGRPGKEIDFQLNKFTEKFGLTLDWARRCLQELKDANLLTVVFKASNTFYRVILHDPDFNPINMNSCPKKEEFCPTIQPSNPHPTVPSFKENKDLKDPEGEFFSQQPESEPSIEVVESGSQTPMTLIQETLTAVTKCFVEKPKLRDKATSKRQPTPVEAEPYQTIEQLQTIARISQQQPPRIETPEAAAERQKIKDDMKRGYPRDSAPIPFNTGLVCLNDIYPLKL